MTLLNLLLFLNLNIKKEPELNPMCHSRFTHRHASSVIAFDRLDTRSPCARVRLQTHCIKLPFCTYLHFKIYSYEALLNCVSIRVVTLKGGRSYSEK